MKSHRIWVFSLSLSLLTGVSCNSIDIVDTNSSAITIPVVEEPTSTPTGAPDPEGVPVSVVISNSPSTVDASKQVCDPFTNRPDRPGADLYHGIVADLKYLADDAPRYSKVQDYQTFGIPVDATLFLNDINVPTRSFSLGFVNQNGETLTNQYGNTLYEYFSVHFEGQIQLTQAEPLGLYQFAMIADDGAIFQMDQGSGFQPVVDNDGTHASKFMGATEPVIFSSMNQKIPFKLDYYQGPRYHISVILLWRPWPTDSSVDSQQGKSGNSLFFDSSYVPSVATSTYKGLLSRGWKPVAPANFVLPDAVASNPCYVATPVTTSISAVDPAQPLTNQTSIQLTLSSSYAAATFECRLDSGDLQACASPAIYSGLVPGSHFFEVFASANGSRDSVGASYSWQIDTTAPVITSEAKVINSDSFTVNWTTDEPSTTQFKWGVGTDTSRVVAEDTNLTTSHSVTITGLSSLTTYSYVLGNRDAAGNVMASSRRVVRTQ